MEGSPFGRLVSVLVSPEKTFRSIAERPTWLVPLVALVLVSLLVTVLITPRVDYAEVIRESVEEQGRQMDEEQMERIVDFTERFKWVNAIVPVALLQPAGYLLIAAIFMVLLRLLEGEIGFSSSLAVTTHAFVPWAVAGLLSVPLILSAEELSLAELKGGILLSHLGFLAPEGSDALHALLSGVDFFSLWTVALLAIGYRVVARVSAATSWGLAIGLWLVWVGGKAALAAIF